MTETYFKSFPTVGEENAVDLLTHVFPVPQSIRLSNYIEPISLNDTDYVERAAHVFYKDPNLFYILFLLNQVINPYEDWVIPDTELSRAVFDKYHDVFIQRHLDRVISQFENFIYSKHSLSVEKKLPVGKYVLRVSFSNRKDSGHVTLKFSYKSIYDSQVIPKTDVDLISVPGIYKKEITFDTNDTKYTKLIVHKDSHIKFKFISFNWQFLSKREMLSSKVENIIIPTEQTFQLGPGEKIYLNIYHSLPDRIFTIEGIGKNLTVELFNSSSMLLKKTYSTTINFQDFIHKILNFNIEKIYSYENSDLYLYSTQLLKSIIVELSKIYSKTNVLEGSINNFTRRVIQLYKERFNPTLYDTNNFTDFNETQKNVIKVKVTTEYNTNLTMDHSNIDYYSLQEGDLVLVRNQAEKNENGIYTLNEYNKLIKYKNFDIESIVVVDYGAKFKNTRWLYNNHTKEFMAYSDIPFSYIYNSDLAISFVASKIYHYYSTDVLNDLHHFETVENTIYGAGMIIDEHFTTKISADSYRAVTNLEYESRKNNQQRKKVGLSSSVSGDFIKKYRDFLLGITL